MNSFDADAQRAKLAALMGRFNNQPSGANTKTEKKFFRARLNQPEIIRIVPISDGDIPIQELKFYYNTGIKEQVGDKNYNISILSPASYGESDPIEMFAEDLASQNPDEFKGISQEIKNKILYQLKSQSKFYIPVVIRGKESQGIKFWGVSEKLLQSLLDNSEKEGYLIYDPVNGRDLKVWIEDMGNYKQTKFELGRVSPLSQEESLSRSLMENQPKLIDQFNKRTFNELQQVITKVVGMHTEQTSEENTQVEQGRDYTSVHESAPTVTEPVVEPEPVAKDNPFEDLPF